MINYKILHGNSKSVLEGMVDDPSECKKYQLIVTSPPYYKQRKYGENNDEIGQEKSYDEYLDNLVAVFSKCYDLLRDSGSLVIVIADIRKNHAKLMLPHKLAIRLTEEGFSFQEDIVWHKTNSVPTSSKTSLAQAYEFVLFLSRDIKPYFDLGSIRTQGSNVDFESARITPNMEPQLEPVDRDQAKIDSLSKIILNAVSTTPLDDLPTTSEISRAYGYDPEKYCPTCFRKFKRHARRKRIGGHSHYPIFAACNPKGKNPGNVWSISAKSHKGNEHFAIFPEELVSRIIKMSTKEGDYVLDPFMGRGTSGIAASNLHRNFTGIDLYAENIKNADRNICSANTCSDEDNHG